MLRRFPTQIEADLSLRGVDLGAWHRGERDDCGAFVLSSRKLLVILRELPELSAFKRDSARGGNWPTWMQMVKHLTNETSLHRAGLYADGDNAYAPMIYNDPLESADRAKEEAALKAELAEHQTDNTLSWS